MTALVVTIREFMQDEDLWALIRGGVRCFRLNAARISRRDLPECATRIRAAAAHCGIEPTLFVDLPGAKPRVWFLGEDYCYQMRRGERHRIFVSESPRDEDCFQIVGPEFFAAIRVGATLRIRAAGYVRLCVEDRSDAWLDVRVLADGLFGGGYHVFIEREYVPSRGLSRADRGVLPVVAELRPDFVCPSFVDETSAVAAVKGALAGAGVNAQVLAKIESPVGLSNLYAIVEAADGAIVGRDDLSVWTDAETLRRETYRVLRCCREHGRVAVTASNYFASVCDGPALNDRDREELAGVLALAPDYLYCNETSTSRRERDAWVLAAARSSGLI